MLNPTNKDSYPISTFTWMVIPTRPDPESAATIRELAHWMLDEGQLFTTKLGYLPLPRVLAARELDAIDSALGNSDLASNSR